jgi:hypothetical protein
MRHHRTTVAALGLAAAVFLTGCAGSAKLSTRVMCEAHGGTYSSQAKQCTYPAQPPPQSAAKICQMHGGSLDPVSDTCAIDDRTK